MSELGVYPRVRGGAPPLQPNPRQSPGLSPRARGSPPDSRATVRRAGSIPACAGEPNPLIPASYAQQVYPRVRGGATLSMDSNGRRWGLSPRARGSQTAKTAMIAGNGSIPACAGEPQGAPDGLRISRVYPRVRGGALLCLRRGIAGWGLSPRARGSRTERSRLAAWRGSIPACAGEPCLGAPLTMRPRVYPRVRGGASTG